MNLGLVIVGRLYLVGISDKSVARQEDRIILRYTRNLRLWATDRVANMDMGVS